MTLVEPCIERPDVIISGHADDAELIKFLTEGVAKQGLSVWFPVADKAQSASQLIPQTKVFIVVLSPSALTVDTLKDDIALAYMANVAIFPTAIKSYGKLNNLIDGGLRLMLSRIQWTFFLKPEHMEPNLASLISSITSYVETEYPNRESAATAGENFDPFAMLSSHMGIAKSTQSGDDQGKGENGGDDQGDDSQRKGYNYDGDFWQRHFGERKEVSYNSFMEKFQDDYSERITENFGAAQCKLFHNLMYKDIFNLTQVLTFERYRRFIGQPKTKGQLNGADSFYKRMQAYVSSSLATRRVLDMDSTVRMTAIQQLGSFKTPHVVRQLKMLTEDADPNIQAVAALALAKTGIKDVEIEDILIKLLSNKDRLVRESACLSLAHMQSGRAMKRVLHVWRNDPISHVRQAAELALSRMGMDEAKEAMKITSVLTQEVTALKEASRQEVKS